MNKIFVGEYTEDELKSGKDKKEIADAQQLTGLQYITSKITKQKTLKVWLTKDFKI